MAASGSLGFSDSTPVLVGREREQAVLRERLTAALAGHGSLVLIGGEAGIGKTALAEALYREAEARGVRVLVGRCYDLTETPPYGPWVELFGHYQLMDDRAAVPDVFRQRGTVGAVASQTELFNQVQDFITTLVAKQPVLVLLDDLHWADPASLDLLRFLARALATMPILVLATYRADELTRRHPLYQLLPVLVREAHAERLDLQRIEETDVRALVIARYPLPDADTARLVSYLHGRSEGNPFFLGELLRTLEAERVLRLAEGGWALGDLTLTRVPILLRQVIDGRLARLDDEAQRLLAMAAVIGQEIPLTLWATVGDTDEEMLARVIEQAIDARMLEPSADGGGMRFVHALIREALYEGIVPLRRRGWHRRIAEQLATQANPDPDAIAYHFRQAEDERAAAWLVRAGERAEYAYAWLMAVERYEQAVRLMESAGADAGERGWLMYRIASLLRHADPRRALATLEEAARLAAQAGDHGLAIYLMQIRGYIRCTIGDHRRGLAELADAADRMERLPADDYARLRARLASEAIPLDRHHGRGTLAVRLTRVGRYAEARAIAERVVADAPPPEEERGRGGSHTGDAYNALIEIYGALGLPERAGWAFPRALATFRATQHYFLVAGSSMHALLWLFLPYRSDDVATRTGVAAEALAAYQHLGEMQGSAYPPRFPILATLFIEGDWAAINGATSALLAPNIVDLPRITLGALARAQGDVERAWTHVRASFPRGPATEPGETEFMSAVASQRLAAALALDAGDLGAAREWLEAHDRWLAWDGVVLGRSEGAALWARYRHAAGERERAYEHARQALAYATEPRQPLALLAAHRLLGELDTNVGRYTDAMSHLDTALTLADACAAPYERALTLLALAELRAAEGRRADALISLDTVRAVCTPLAAKPALARADALAARLTAGTTPASTYPAGLSAREVEVLRLVAGGLTNAQVAERLFLSPHTINSHLTAIYNKLGVTSRSAAIRFALDHDLR